MRGTLGKDVGDRILEQATYALRDLEDYGRCDNLGLKHLFAEMTEEGLEKRPQTQEMDTGDEAIPDVPNDNKLFEDYMDLDDTQRETNRTRRGRVIKGPTHLDDYGV